MKSLIIGGAGFVGQYLIKHLVKDLNQDIVATKLENEIIEYPDIDVRELDILNREEIKKILCEVQPDFIYHLAAQSSVALSWKNPTLTVDVNIKGVINLLESVRELEYRPRVLIIGSSEEYGKISAEKNPVTEECNTNPGNIYAVTKVCQNMISKIYTQAYNMDIIMVRAFNHVGPYQASDFVVSDFCRQVAEIENGKRPPVIYVGNLSAKRDFTDVRDIVRAYSMIMDKGIAGEIYNVGSGNAIEISNILKIILSFSEKNIEIQVDKQKLRPVDCPVIEADITKLVQTTGWKRIIDISNTIEDTLNYWRRKEKSISK